MSPKCVVLGGGGHAKMVVETLLAEGRHRLVGVTDLRGSGSVLGIPIVGDDSALPRLKPSVFVVGVGGVPDNRPRAAIYRKGCAAGYRGATAIHPSAVVARSSSIGPGTVVFPRAVVNPDCEIGENVIVNTAAVVEHDSRIADHAHVAPGAILCGSVEIGEGAFVGAGAVVRQGIRVGAWAMVAAGSVVVKDVPPGGRVAGVPARSMKKRR